MVLVAGLDRLEGTKVGPWLSDAEWQDHTREVRARFEARSDTSVAFQDFCREYAEISGPTVPTTPNITH